MNGNMRGLSKVLKAAVGGLASPDKSRKRSNRQKKSRPGRINVGQGTGAWGRALPASYASHVKPGFRIINRSATSTRVAGCDLVYPLPAEVASHSGSDELLFSVIPANPAYWTGTRIAQIAPAYMNYRPLALTFHYIPQVAVTQPGSVIYGTLWNGSAPSGDLQQTLNTSNGGGIINCYVPATTRIALGNNLQQNLFTLNGAIEPDTSPFVFVAVARGCVNDAGTQQIVPGYWMVDYVYDFKNPIGQTWVYDRSLATQMPYTSWALPNRSIILLEAISGYGPGTIFDCETDSSGNVIYLYRGSTVTIPPGTFIQAFENGQTGTVQDLARRAQGSLPKKISGFSDGSEVLHFSYMPQGGTSSAGVWRIDLVTGGEYDGYYHIERPTGSITRLTPAWICTSSAISLLMNSGPDTLLRFGTLPDYSNNYISPALISIEPNDY